MKYPPRKKFFNGEVVYSHLVGPKPNKDSIMGVCSECMQAQWYTWLEKNDEDGLREVAVVVVHADALGFQRCKGSGTEPLGM